MMKQDSPFAGFKQEALDWMLGLALDNSRDYFLKHKAIYEGEVRGPFENLLQELSESFGGTVKVFRPNRDVRFSADKSPYKLTVSGYLHSEADKGARYISLDPEGLFAATGYYQMASDQLARYRVALTTDDDALALGDELRTIILRDGVTGEQLKTAPRGVAKDSPNIDLLRYKELVIHSTLPFESADREGALTHIKKTWKSGDDLNRWLSKHVGTTTTAWS